MILLPKYKDIIIPARAKIGLAGRYKIEAVGADGRRRVLADWFPNLITTLGADLLGNGSPLNVCAVGSGNTAPALTDTALQTLVGSTSSIQSTTRAAAGSSPYFGSTTIIYNFVAGTATGNLAEVGVGATSTSLFSRALILDGGGSPTTITVLSTEALFVTYQLNQYVPLVDVTGTINISGTNYNYTLRGAEATSANWGYLNGDRGGLSTVFVFNGAIGAITGDPSGSSAGGGSIVNDAYSNGSHTLSGTVTYGIGSGNLAGGISAAEIFFGSAQSSRGTYQIGFATPIPKDSSHVLTLSFSSSWAINTP